MSNLKKEHWKLKENVSQRESLERETWLSERTKNQQLENSSRIVLLLLLLLLLLQLACNCGHACPFECRSVSSCSTRGQMDKNVIKI